MIKFEKEYLGNENILEVWKITQGRHCNVTDIFSWLKENKTEIFRVLDYDGALLLRGFDNLNSAKGFEHVLGALWEKLMDYVGGTSPRKVVEGKISTATTLPSNYSIPMHQEMTYTKNPPSYVTFLCDTRAKEGGTVLGDMRAITKSIDPSTKERFTKGGMQLRRTLTSVESIDKKPGIPKPWNEVFDTEDREEADMIIKKKGWKAKWLKDNSVQLWQEHLPALKTYDKTNEEIWFCQPHIYAPASSLKWALRDERLEQHKVFKNALKNNPEMMDQVYHQGEIAISDEDVVNIYDVHADAEIPIDLIRTDLLLLNNTLIVHGRTRFVGERLILAALVPS